MPYTRLSTKNIENTADQAGAFADIMAILAGIFLKIFEETSNILKVSI